MRKAVAALCVAAILRNEVFSTVVLLILAVMLIVWLAGEIDKHGHF